MTRSQRRWLWEAAISFGFPTSMDLGAIAAMLFLLVCMLRFVTPLAAETGNAPAAACVGDCDNSGSVTIDEIVTGVDITLETVSLDRCPQFDCNANGEVTVDCIIRAVSGALNGCAPPATASSTPAASATATNAATPTSTPTVTPQSADHFVDNSDGTITDTQTSLVWEKKDRAGGLHDVNRLFPWAGVCTDDDGVPCIGVIGCELCQPDAAAESTCNAATGGAQGCAQCRGAAICQPINGLTTVWQWLNQINAAGFGGHSDWRIPTIGRDGGAAQLETIVDTTVPGCGSGVPCVAATFNASCDSGCVATSCSCTDIGQYWSATSIAETLPLPSVWSVLFFRGSVGGADKTSGFFARAVRSVPNGPVVSKFGSR